MNRQQRLDHHYVPQLALRPWSSDGIHVWVYRTLVSHDQVPTWRRVSLAGIGYQKHLYTRRVAGGETDNFEVWLEHEVDTPSAPLLRKLIDGGNLTPQEWATIGRFVGAQDLRTPRSYIESKGRWEEQLPSLLDSVLQESLRDLEAGHLSAARKPTAFENPEGIFRVEIETPEADSEKAGIRAEVTIGRAMWLESIQRLSPVAASVLGRHHWSVAAPATGMRWFTTDHPVLKLNYNNPSEYDFKGGWGSNGTEIMMPISPGHLLYTKVGHRFPPRFQFAREQTFLVQRFLGENALRYIFAAEPSRQVSWHRPRRVDRDLFLEEAEAWRRWHEEQSASESG